jgi:outer membrane receptor protein involved in Fe transport
VKKITWLLAAVFIVPLAFAGEVTTNETKNTVKTAETTKAEATAEDVAAPAATEGSAKTASELSERLIYSVDRVPERPFDTARAVEVITISDLWRKSGMDVADVLEHETGMSIINYDPNGGVPLVRGLHGKQIMVMIDGVKVNDAMWRSASKDYLGIIDLSQVERIEIVRGVVSVLGTESLAGVVNIITKKGSPNGESFGGSVGTRYTTANGAFTSPIEVYGQSGSIRWNAGANYLNVQDNKAGSGIGKQPGTSYNAQGFYGSMQYLMSTDKTISASYRNVVENNFQRAWQVASGTDTWYNDGPAEFKLASVSYQDLTDRSFEDSFRVTGYFNQQADGRDEIRVASPTTQNFANELDNMGGLNLEFGKFLFGSHHFLYGVDSTMETVHSKAHDLNLKTGAQTNVRGRYTDGATYQTTGVYVQDRFDIGRWLTTTAGVRYGTFQSDGQENSTFGVISLDNKKSDLTSALNFVFHPTQHLNLIANAMRGFRAPNIDDLSRFSVRSNGTDVPNPNATSEHVNSYEVGAKYEGGRLSGSAFYYNNSFSNLLVRLPGTFNGLPFLDQNGNGKQDAKEPLIYQLQNVGTAKVSGFEADFRYVPRTWLNVTGNITKTRGTDTLANVPLERIPPIFGNLTFGIFGSSARRLWGEFIFDFAGSQHRLSPNDVADFRIGPNGTYAYKVYSVRGGTTIADRLRLTLGVDNLTNKAYKTHDSFVYRPGRQLVVGTEYRF